MNIQSFSLGIIVLKEWFNSLGVGVETVTFFDFKAAHKICTIFCRKLSKNIIKKWHRLASYNLLTNKKYGVILNKNKK